MLEETVNFNNQIINKLLRISATTFFVILTILSSCKQADKEIIDRWDNGQTKTAIYFKSKIDSTFTKTEYFENGKVKSIQEFVNGKLNGKLINYSEKGFKQQEFNYVNGQKNGVGTAWYESGKIAFQFKFKDNFQYDGTEYFENGIPRVLVKFSAPGKREGKALYFDEDGNIWLEGYFKKGKKDSIWTKFDKGGNIIEKYVYKNGEKSDP